MAKRDNDNPALGHDGQVPSNLSPNGQREQRRIQREREASRRAAEASARDVARAIRPTTIER